MHSICTLPPAALLRYLFPLVVEVGQVAHSKFEDDEEEGSYVEFMKSACFSVTPVSHRFVTDEGAFLINNGRELILFVGHGTPVLFIQTVGDVCDLPSFLEFVIMRS